MLNIHNKGVGFCGTYHFRGRGNEGCPGSLHGQGGGLPPPLQLKGNVNHVIQSGSSGSLFEEPFMKLKSGAS